MGTENSIMAESRVTSAKLHANGCEIQFEGRARVEAGRNLVLACRMPAKAERDSVQVRVPEGVQVLSVSVEHPDDPSPEEQAHMDEARRIRDEAGKVKSKIDARKEQAALWTSPEFAGRVASGGGGAAAYVEDMTGRLEGLYDEIRTLSLEEKDLLEDAKREIDLAVAAADSHKYGYVAVRLESPAEGEMPFEVSAVSSAASWSPTYEVSVDDKDSPMRIRTRATIRQSTANDWEGVSLTLDATRLSKGYGYLPQPSRIRLRKYERRHVRMEGALAKSARPGSADFLDAGYAFGAEDASAEAWNALASVTDSPFGAPVGLSDVVDTAALDRLAGMEYAVPGTWDVPSGGDAVVDVQETELSSRLLWVAVPSETPDVHIAARLGEALPFGMSGQSATVRIAGQYRGHTHLSCRRIGMFDNLVDLGADDRVTTHRKTIDRSTVRTMLRGQETTRYEYELEVESQRDDDVPLIVADSVPVSDDQAISISLEREHGMAVEKETGTVCWQLTLPAGETAKKSLRYSVAKPKEMEIEELRG